jgi:hypothetical protein
MKLKCLMCDTVSEQAETVVYSMTDVRCPGCGTVLRIVPVPRNVDRDEPKHSRVDGVKVMGLPHHTAEVA